MQDERVDERLTEIVARLVGCAPSEVEVRLRALAWPDLDYADRQAEIQGLALFPTSLRGSV